METSPRMELFAFELHYANKIVDYGLILATDRETAKLHLEGLSLLGVEAIIVQGQEWAIRTLTDKFGGMAVFTHDLLYN